MFDRPPKPPSLGTMRLAGLGVELAASVGGCCLIGYWIDHRFKTDPWALLICSVVGIVGGLYNLVRQAIRQSAEDTKRSSRKDGSDGGTGS